MTDNVIDFNNAKRQSDLGAANVDADDIRRRLHDNPRSFVEWLYSGRALITKSEARIGDVVGTPGASLSIQLHGPNAGLWKDHATDESGDLISLYRACMGYTTNDSFVQSIKEIAHDYLGDPIEIERPIWQPTPIEKIEKNKAKLGTKPRADMIELGAPVATYRYEDTRGNIMASVVRYEPDGTRASKTFRPYCFRTIDGNQKWVPGAPDLRPLYRLPAITLSSEVVLVEGEGCAETLAKLGIEATSAMQGAHAPIDKTDWSPLAGKKVIIWPDNDLAGFNYAKTVADRLLSLGCTVLGVTPPTDVPPKWDAVDCVAEGRDVYALLATATTITADSVKPVKERIRVLDIDQLEDLQPPVWLVSDVLTEGGLSMLWGRSGALKSFVALDMGLCIASGMAWHGRPVKQGLVLYIAAEGSHGLAKRAVGWRRSRGRDAKTPQFKLIPHSIVMTSDDLPALLAIVEQFETKPVLIVLDTVARTFGLGDENKTPDMNAYVIAADKLREATGANVLVVHHSGVLEERRERGSSALRGAADTVIKVARDGEKLDLINHGPEGKQKDAEEFKTIKLRIAKVAFELQGAEQSTLILNLREDDDEASDEIENLNKPRLGKNEKAVLDALGKAAEALGFIRLRGMTGLHQESLRRALNSLVEKELITVADDASGNSQVWDLPQ